MSSSPKRSSTTKQYERKLARQRQLELMEAAASGVAPAMELDTSSLNQVTGSTSSSSSSSGAASLRSRSNDRGGIHRGGATPSVLFQHEEEEVRFTNSPPGKSNKATVGSSLFDQRGRPDGFPVAGGLNLMDHETGIYHEQSRTEQFLARLRSLFGSGGSRSNNNTMNEPVGDYLDYHRSSGKSRHHHHHAAAASSFPASLWVDKKRRFCLLLLLTIGIVIVALTSISAAHGPSEKVLRQQNNQRFNRIMDYVVHEGVSPASVFLNYTSAEYHALRWSAYSDPARLPVDDPMTLTRYALAVFFYNSFLTFEKYAGRQKPIEIGTKQWEGVPNPGWIRKDHWMTEKGVCMWYGVHCAELPEEDPVTESKTQYDANLPVTAIKIRKNNIMGSLPLEFRALHELNLLDLKTNKLSGSFPTHMGQLFSLEYLHLSDNHMRGSLPGDIGMLESLKTLDLRHNDFSGQVPSQLNRLFDLELLQLSQNKFAGSVPRLNDLKKLAGLHLDHNELDKPFPFSLAMQSSLKELHLNNNKISGTLHNEIESIRKLEKLRLEENKMGGSIPLGVLSRLSHLREFNIDNNDFTGPFPEDMSALTQIAIISASENNLKGNLPKSMGTLSTLEKLHLNFNDFEGQIPWSFGNLTSVKELWLEHNRLQSKIPVSLGSCRHLETLFLDHNKLTGPLPTSLGKITNLRTLRLQENNLEGDMPQEVCRLRDNHQLTFLAADCKNKITCKDQCCNQCL